MFEIRPQILKVAKLPMEFLWNTSGVPMGSLHTVKHWMFTTFSVLHCDKDTKFNNREFSEQMGLYFGKLISYILPIFYKNIA